MWVSKKEYCELCKRVVELESSQYIWHSSYERAYLLNDVVRILLDYLKIKIIEEPSTFKLQRKDNKK